jgi:hypothetical protein
MANSALITILSLAIVFAPHPCSGDNAEMKSKDTAEVLAVVERLHKLASDPMAQKAFDREKLAQVINALAKPAQLVKLAILTHVIADPGKAEDAPYDRWFHQAFLECIYKLRDMDDPGASDALTELKSMLTFDGGDSLTIREAIETRSVRSKAR